MTEPLLDHLVYAVPDLTAGVAWFTAHTGVTPVAGGRHPGGTANYLVGLGATAYLEIIGPDPDPDPDAGTPDRPRAFGLETLTEPRLVTWAIHPVDLDATVVRAQARGYDPGEASPLSRRTPDGTLLAWRLTPGPQPATVGLVPFLIDWGTTAHPAGAGLPQLRLVALTAVHPDPSAVRRDLDAIGAHLDVEPGTPAVLRAVLDTPRGAVTLS